MLRVIITSVLLFFISQYIVMGKDAILPRKKTYTFYNFLSIFCLYSFLNMILWQYELNFLIVITFIFILSIAMYYVHEFRGTNLNFSDIASINTAKEVAGGYTYEIKPSFVIYGIIIISEIIVQVFVFKIDIFKNYHKVLNGVESINIDKYRFFWHEIGQVAAFFISFFILRDKISKEKFDYSLFAGENEGYIYNFVSSIPLFHKSDNTLEESIAYAKDFIFRAFTFKRNKKEKYQSMVKYKQYATIEENAPHVIVIMNESFGSLHRRIKTNKAVTPFYDNLTGVIKGDLYVNTFGGGTANTEFEFLTGMTVGNYPYPVMPYNNFVRRYKYSLARYFGNLGYKTVAMHPYTATNYHRDKVYKYFGFDKLVFMNDMKDKSKVRTFISDAAMYNEVIKQYRIAKSESKKSFIFGVTVQNHSGYQKFDGSDVLTMTRNLKNRDSLDAYMSLMRISDSAIRDLVAYFEKEDDHTIILFFGDHNASFGTEINKEFYEDKENYAFTNAYATPFFIYDNKSKEEKYIKSISANFLSLELLKKANMPLDMIHHVMNGVYKEFDTYNYHKAKYRYHEGHTNIKFDEYMKLEKEYLKK